jgi:hypothetical protein
LLIDVTKELIKEDDDEGEWIDTEGEITSISKNPGGTYDYILTYAASESIYRSSKGKLENGLIEEFFFDKPHQPIMGQKVNLKYRKDFPYDIKVKEKIALVEKKAT